MDRNAELSEFLRSRRARLRPHEAGVPVDPDGGARRVPGLRRAELARLAGVSTDYYSRLEQGRLRNVSDAVLDAVTEHEPDWLAVYLEFGRRLKADAGLRERWLAIAPPEARERSRAWIERGQASGDLRADVSSEEISQFLGVVIDGIVAQRALGFDAPQSDVVRRFVRDATRAGPRSASGSRSDGDYAPESSSA